MFKTQLLWRDPTKFLPVLPEMESYCLLYSALIGDGFGRYSLLALWPNETITNWNEADPKKTWFGYFGYGLKNELEKLPEDKASSRFKMPDCWLTNYHFVATFDHFNKTLQVEASSQEYIDKFAALEPTPAPAPTLPEAPFYKNLNSNMSKKEYLSKVKKVLDAIKAGDVYQANLTRKFFGEWSKDVSPIAVFNALCRYSPAPYSALLKCGANYILSSSPEMFLDISKDGKVTTKPIKGSAPRSRDLEEDKRIRAELETSEKNRAENLMIVDLMRNDLSRSCEAGSIEAENLYDITSYLTVHHMSSTISGQKMEHKTALDVVKGCFPPGSMTGAPKIKAMELCSELEQDERGVYSGAIGVLNADGSAHFSVVIRTLLMNDNGFEFQVGGGIVSDSTPEGEWQETLIKSRGISAALKLPEEELASL